MQTHNEPISPPSPNDDIPSLSATEGKEETSSNPMPEMKVTLDIASTNNEEECWTDAHGNQRCEA